MESIAPLGSIPGPARINRRLPDSGDEHDRDLERDARTNDPKGRERHEDDESESKPHHHGGRNPRLGKHLDLDA